MITTTVYLGQGEGSSELAHRWIAWLKEVMAASVLPASDEGSFTSGKAHATGADQSAT